MKAYIITFNSPSGPGRRFEPSKAAAERFAREQSAGDDPDVQDGIANPEIRAEEIPTDKKGLIAWLNRHAHDGDS